MRRQLRFNGVTPFGNRDAARASGPSSRTSRFGAGRSRSSMPASLAGSGAGQQCHRDGVAQAIPFRCWHKMYGLSPWRSNRSMRRIACSATGQPQRHRPQYLVPHPGSETAFEPRWGSTDIVVFRCVSTPSVRPINRPLTNDEFSLVEMNFSALLRPRHPALRSDPHFRQTPTTASSRAS